MECYAEGEEGFDQRCRGAFQQDKTPSQLIPTDDTKEEDLKCTYLLPHKTVTRVAWGNANCEHPPFTSSSYSVIPILDRTSTASIT